MDTCIHTANLLYLASYLVREMLWLRVLTLVGLLLGIVFFSCHGQEMLAPIVWHAVFAVINMVQIGRLLRERRLAQSDAELSLQHMLSQLSREELMTLIARANWGVPDNSQAQSNSRLAALAPNERVELAPNERVELEANERVASTVSETAVQEVPSDQLGTVIDLLGLDWGESDTNRESGLVKPLVVAGGA